MAEPDQKPLIGITGSGAMGGGIAQVAAATGHKVFVYDINAEVLSHASSNLKSALDKLMEKQKISKEKAENILKNIHWTENLNDFKDCKLIIEAVVENLEVKQKVFSDLEKIVADDCVLATNTSSLSIASVASACSKPGRVLGIHFFNPAPVMPLVEIIPGIATEITLVKKIKELIDSWGKTTVIAKDTPGFIVNRIARPFYGESIRIYEEGMADFATIDWAMKEFGKFKMGPFELMDFIGNDVNYKVTETVWEQLFFDQRYKPSLTQKRLYEAKRFGRKSGRGYYDYSAGAKMSEPKKDNALCEYIFMRVLAVLVNEAIVALYLNIASRDDIETAMTKGVNYPKGLLKWGEEIGLKNILAVMQDLYETYCEDRYRPSVLLKSMVREKKSFF